jgi:hypothetical protein
LKMGRVTSPPRVPRPPRPDRATLIAALMFVLTLAGIILALHYGSSDVADCYRPGGYARWC